LRRQKRANDEDVFIFDFEASSFIFLAGGKELPATSSKVEG